MESLEQRQLLAADITASFTAASPDPRNTAVTSINITFSEPVLGFVNSDVVLTRGGADLGLAANGGYVTSADGGAGAVWTVVMPSSLTSPGGDYVITLTDTGPVITSVDGAADTMDLTVAAATDSWVVDVTAPTVTNVTSTSDGLFKAGTVIPITVTFSDVVTVAGGTPTLALGDGGTATYASGSGTSTLTFNYTVGAGENSDDLDYAATDSLALAGATIKDAVGNNATLTLAAPGAATSLGANRSLVIDTTAPTVTNVTSATADGSYKAGTVIPITVTFSEAVTVAGGTPTLALSGGGTATYASGSTTDTLTFNYTVGAGQNSADLDYANTTALALAGATITDALGNNATLTLAAPGAATSLGDNKALVIDTTAATVTNVTSETANGSYKAGTVIPITVTFSEAVTVAGGTPTLAMGGGGTATYVSGSTTDTLTFNYTVGAGEISADLDYANTTALALVGATITDAVGNNATLTLAAPGAATSLGANKALVIDTTAPTATITLNPAAGTTVANTATIAFNQAVTGFTLGKLSLTKGGVAVDLTTSPAATVTTTDNITWTLTGLAAKTAGAGAYVLKITAAASNVEDAAGNEIAVDVTRSWTLAALTTPPVISIVATDAAADESGSNTGQFTLYRTGPVDQALTVKITIRGTARAVTGYAALSKTVTFAANSPTATILVTPVANPTVRPDKTVKVWLAKGSGYSVTTDTTKKSATVLIADYSNHIKIEATDNEAKIAGLQTATFTLTRTGGDMTQALTVPVSIRGSARNGRDYTTVANTVTFLAGQTTATITITPIVTAKTPRTVVIRVKAGKTYLLDALHTDTARIVA